MIGKRVVSLIVVALCVLGPATLADASRGLQPPPPEPDNNGATVATINFHSEDEGEASLQSQPGVVTCWAEAEHNNAAPIDFKDIDGRQKIEFEGEAGCDLAPNSMHLRIYAQRWDGSTWRNIDSSATSSGMFVDYIDHSWTRACTVGYWRTRAVATITHGNTIVIDDYSTWRYISCV